MPLSLKKEASYSVRFDFTSTRTSPPLASEDSINRNCIGITKVYCAYLLQFLYVRTTNRGRFLDAPQRPVQRILSVVFRPGNQASGGDRV